MRVRACACTPDCRQFKKMLINGVSYGLGTTQIGLDRMRRLGITPPEGSADSDEEDGPHLDAQGHDRNGRVPVPHVTFKDGSDSHPGRTFFGDLVNPVRCRALSTPATHAHHTHTCTRALHAASRPAGVQRCRDIA